MAPLPSLDLPMRLAVVSTSNNGDKDNGDKDNGDKDNGDKDNGDKDNGDKDNDGKGTDDKKSSDESHNTPETMNLMSMRGKLPRQNFSAHPNVKLLPGLDFGIAPNAPFTSQQLSGLVAKILFPGKAAQQPPSFDGLLDVADRIECLMGVAVRTFQANPNLPSARDVFSHALRQVRELGGSWNFDLAPRKSSVILGRLVDARKRFLSNGGDMSVVGPRFLSYLRGIDDFIRIVEAGIDAKKPTATPSASAHFKTYRPRSTLPNKLPRITRNDGNASETSFSTPEDELAFWRSKYKSLEADIVHAERQAENASVQANLEWFRRMRQVWQIVRPAVNSERKHQGKHEWEEDQLGQFLRASKLNVIADDMLGMKH
ncbi:hypothetical protein CcaCcLH18_12315 [Colletotrichum camelliae]|nr:hypothetical protein CcaCcLH18_12315 [Colletotrichum camelliae]